MSFILPFPGNISRSSLYRQSLGTPLCSLLHYLSWRPLMSTEFYSLPILCHNSLKCTYEKLFWVVLKKKMRSQNSRQVLVMPNNHTFCEWFSSSKPLIILNSLFASSLQLPLYLPMPAVYSFFQTDQHVHKPIHLKVSFRDFLSDVGKYWPYPPSSEACSVLYAFSSAVLGS